MARFALIVGQQSAYLYRLRAASATLQQAVSLAEAEPRDWLALELTRGAHCTVLTDFLDEAYALSVLPPLWLPSARAQLLARRLNNQYRGAELRVAIVPGGHGFKPPAMASLFNLGQADVVSRWVAALEQLEVRVDGVWTFASLVAAAYAHRARAAHTPALLVVETPSGLRQVAVVGAAPVFSRLAMPGETGAFDFDSACAETQRTAQYLFSQSWVPSSAQPLDTRLWLRKAPVPQVTLPQRMDALLVSAVLAQTDTYGQALASVRRLPLAQQLLPLDRLLRWRAHQVGRGALVVAGVMLAVAVAWAGLAARDVLVAQSRTQQQDQEAQQIEEVARKEVLQAKGDVTQAALAEASVSAWRTAVADPTGPAVALNYLAQALGKVPEVSLDSVAWQVKNPWAEADQAAPTPSLGCEVAATGAAPVDPAATPAPAPAPETKPALAVLRFSGELPAELSPRAAVEAQGKLLALLQQPRWRVSTRQAAFETDPSQALVGALGAATKRPIEQCIEWVAP